MKKQLAMSLLFASTYFLQGCYAQENSDSNILSRQEINDPDFIANWLISHKHIDQTMAKHLFEQGIKEKQREAWSSASKYFGESMIRYPRPEALSAYTEVKLQMLAMVRKREGDIQEKLPLDMNNALKLYRSALSANMVLGTLSEEEKKRIQGHVDCLQAYAASGRSDMDCQPLRWYYSAAR